jgi:hypothetical protein
MPADLALQKPEAKVTLNELLKYLLKPGAQSVNMERYFTALKLGKVGLSQKKPILPLHFNSFSKTFST